MIILEGPDGAGKTTLIETLRERFDLPVAPRVVSKEAEAMVDLKRWVELNVVSGFQNMIFDRHRLISEPIYGAVLRQSFEPGFDDWRWFTLQCYLFYRRVHPILIYCLPPYEEVRKNVHTGDDNKRVKDSIRKIYALYTAKAGYDHAMWGAQIYDYTHPENLESIYKDIEVAITTGIGHHY